MSKFAEVLARVEAEDAAIDAGGNDGGAGDASGEVGSGEADTAGDSGGAGLDDTGNSAADAMGEGGNSTTKPVGTDKPAGAVEDKPGAAAKSPEDDRRAAQFAALKREKSEALRLRGEVESKAKSIEERERALQGREAELNGYLDNPKLFFEHLQKRHGIDSFEKLQEYAKPDWKKGTPAPKEEDKPLTKAEVEKLFQEEEQRRVNRAASYAAEQEFEKIVEGDEKYDAAFLVYSPEERAMHGHRIANQLRQAGESFTLHDIADAVDELARQSRKYATIQGRYERKKPSAGTPEAGKSAKSAVNPASTQRQLTTPAKQPSESTPTERPTDKNGMARLPHRERLQRLMRG